MKIERLPRFRREDLPRIEMAYRNLLFELSQRKKLDKWKHPKTETVNECRVWDSTIQSVAA